MNTVRKFGLAAAAAAMLAPLPLRCEVVSMTMAQVLNAVTALQNLDGFDRFNKDGDKTGKDSYKISGDVRISIAADLSRLKTVANDFQTARNGKIMELTAGAGTIKPGSPEEGQFGKELTAMLDTKRDVDVVRLSKVDLGLLPPQNNPIPPTDLSNLGPLFDDGAGAAK